MPLANALLTAEQLNQPEAFYPLELVFCPHCTLVQILETVPPETLFRNYLYFSSVSVSYLEHSKKIAHQMIAQRGLTSSSLAVEIASNDGYLLQYYRDKGIPILGIEPAANIANVAQERGIPTICEFFNEALARQLRDQGKAADVLHANNVIAHVADLNGFVAGMVSLLKPTGIAVIEIAYVKDMLDSVEFDTIYHEHLCYYSLAALDQLFRRHALLITDVEHLSIHGGSLRVFVQHQSIGSQTERVKQFLAYEAQAGLQNFETYLRFKEPVEQLKNVLLDLLRNLKASGNSIAVYGASAKGTTLLNYLGIGRDLLDFVVDLNVVKQGFFTPGTHLLIEAPEKLLVAQPDYLLLLTWNFADEILAQQSEYRKRGGRFIIPLPQLRVV